MRWIHAQFAVVAVVSCFAGAIEVESATLRALVVGIDTYRVPGTSVTGNGRGDPRMWSNLKGAKNDAERMRAVLKSFGFKKENIETLLDGEATRSQILSHLDAMAAATADGDLLFVFIASHGSQVTNSLSAELDKLDESIVPVDALSGVKDIRDKELRDRFNKVLDNGGELVAIFDSCHSGSVTRGPDGDEKAMIRQAPPDPRDVRDASTADSPWERGALVVSSSRDHQVSHEGVDQHGKPGGIFTIALTQALQSSPANEPASLLVRRVKALMSSTGKVQEPTIEATVVRGQLSLFGAVGPQVSGRAIAMVSSKSATGVALQEGLAAGFTVGSELAKEGAELPRLKITSVDGMSRSTAVITEGSADDVHAGDLFVIDRWAPPDEPTLRVWMPRPAQDGNDLAEFTAALKAGADSKGYGWVTDPTETRPTHVVAWTDGSWWLAAIPSPGEPSLVEPVSLGEAPSFSNVSSHLSEQDVTLFVNVPPPQALQQKIQLGPNTPNNAVVWAEREVADYHLVGNFEDGELYYGWDRPGTFSTEGTSLPVRTDRVSLIDALSPDTDQLEVWATRLGRVRAWLRLQGPAHTEPYRYRLVLKDESGEIHESGPVQEGSIYSLALVSDMPAGGPARYVYVFVLDSKGQSTLVFPQVDSENRFPLRTDDEPRATYDLPASRFRISPPFGTDTFVLLSLSEPLPDKSVLTQPGVLTRSAMRTQSQLSDLLGNMGARTRSVEPVAIEEEWSILRLPVESRPRD